MNDTVRSDWNFDTVKSMAALGTFRGSAKDLMMPPGMIPEESDDFDDTDDSIDTGVATKGSDPILSNSQASHSTVIIKSPIPPVRDADITIDDDDAPTGKIVVFGTCYIF